MDSYDRRILDEQDNEISDPDLTLGNLIEEYIIKKEAKPVDNITKFAWNDDDYEHIYRYVTVSEEERSINRITELKRKLSDTDYVVMKVIEGVSTFDDYPTLKTQRQQWRDEINALETKML